MARPPLPIGTWGKISRSHNASGQCTATARYRDYDGRTRLVQKTGTTPAGAERALLTALRDRAKRRGEIDITDITGDTSLEELARLWLDRRSSEKKLARGTLDGYADIVRVHIVPALGGVRVREVTVGRLDRFIRAVPGDTSSRHCRVVLSGMLKLAAQHGAIDFNPVRDTTVRTPKRKPPRALTVEQLQRLRRRVRAWAGSNTFGPPRGLDIPEVFDVLAGTGARIGEVLAIRECDIVWPTTAVDKATGTEVYVPGSVTITGTVVGNQRQPTPKTTNSERTIVLPKFAADALARQVARRLPSDDGLVFPSTKGTPRTTHNVRTALRTARQHVLYDADGKADGPPDEFDWVTPHAFRRTVATMVERAAGLESAAEQLGNTPAVAQRHYVERAAVAPDLRHVLDNLAAPS